MPLHAGRPIVAATTKLAADTVPSAAQVNVSGMPVDVISGVVAGSIQAAFKFGQFILEVSAASEETRIFGKLIKRVQADREETMKERQRNDHLLVQHPAKLHWVDRALSDIDDALMVIGRIIEDARVDTIKYKSVTLEHKFAWVLKNKSQFIEQQRYLTTCHISLGFVLAYLHGLAHAVAVVSDISPASQEDLDRDASRPMPLRGPASRRPKPRQPPSIPAVSPGDEEPLLAEVMESLSIVTTPEDGLSVESVPWTNIGDAAALDVARRTLDSALGQPHPLSTTLVDPSQQQQQESGNGPSGAKGSEQVAGQIGAMVRQEVDRMTAAELTRRESILRRSRNVAAHFGS